MFQLHCAVAVFHYFISGSTSAVHFARRVRDVSCVLGERNWLLSIHFFNSAGACSNFLASCCVL